MMTQMLESAGYNCGENLQPPGDDNPNGYWEDILILSINEKLQKGLNRDWSSLGLVSSIQIRELTEYESLKKKAVDYIALQVNLHRRFALKDPRICMLMPFWNDVFAEIDAEVKFVVVKRDIVAIAKSLFRRDQISPFHAYQLTILHWAQVSHYALNGKIPWFGVDYESLGQTDANDQFLERLSQFLDIELDKTVKALTKYEPALNHGQADDFANDSRYLLAFQSDFKTNFPIAMNRDQYNAFFELDELYCQCSFWLDRTPTIQKISNSIERFADSLGSEQLIVYGAGSVAKLVVNSLKSNILYGVDRAIENKTTLYGIDFYPVSYLHDRRDYRVLVTVTNRKQQIYQQLEQYQAEPLFIEDFFDEAKNY